MRIIIAAAMVSALTGSAYCQTVNMSGGHPAIGFPLGDKPSADPDPQSAEHESAYKSAIEKIPAKKKKSDDDPWSGVRSSSGQKSNR